MAPSAKNSNGFLGLSIGRFPAPNLAGSLSSLVVRKSNRINGVGRFAAELLPNSVGRSAGLGWGGAADFWFFWGGRGRVWRQLQISFPAHAENTKSKAATGSKAVWLFTFLDSPVNHDDPANDRNQI